MKITSTTTRASTISRSGKINAAMIFVIAAAFMLGYLLEPSLNLKNEDNNQPTQITETPSTPQPDFIPTPEPQQKIIPTPEPEPPTPDEEIAKNPTQADSIVTPAKKSEVDLLLEKHFPLPDFAPLEKIVNQWQNIPPRAMPELTTVKQTLTYKDPSDGSELTEKPEHLAVPISSENGSVTLGHQSNPDLQAQISIDQTDLQQRVTDLYNQKSSAAIEKILAKREENRPKAIAILTQREENPSTPEQDLADNSSENDSAFTKDLKKFVRDYGKNHRGDFFPSPANGKTNSYEHEMPMGPIGGLMIVYYDKREAKIKELWKSGPGSRAGLEEGDIITKIAGKTPPDYSNNAGTGGQGLPERLGLEMIAAQASGRPIELTIQRGEETLEISIELPAAPAFAKTLDGSCLRSQALSHAAAEYLIEVQKEDDKWPGNPYTHAWCGLSLLATGDPSYEREIKKFARTLAKQYDFGSSPSDDELMNDIDSNWFVTMNGIFLAEYYLATGDKTVLDALNYCCRAMEKRIEPDNGRFGHSNGPERLPYGKKGLVIINVHAHIMWALESIIKDQDSYVWTTWNLSYDKAIKPSIGGDGGVGYNFSARGGSQSSPRTGAMLTALALAEKDKGDQRSMGKWLSDNHNVFPNVHAMTFIGPAFGFTGLKNYNERKYQDAFESYHWLFSLIQPVNYDHGSYYYCDRGNSGGDGYCNTRIVGNCMTLTVLNSYRNNTLFIFGNRQKNWLK